MQSWMISEISILVIFGILAFLFQMFFGWRAHGSLGGNGALGFMYGIVFPSLFLMVSLVNGTIYHFTRQEPKMDVFFVASIVIPVIGLVSVITYATMRIMKNKRDYEKEEKLQLEAMEACEDWVDQFPFMKKEQIVKRSLGISKGEIYGYIMVKVYTKEEKEIVESRKNDLPGNMKCMCVLQEQGV